MTPPSQEYRLIPLTQSQFAKVNAEDYELVSIGRRWFANWRKHPNTFYAHRNVRHARCHYGSESMHRVVMGLGYGDPRQVDHINHDGLDNRRSNLRIVTRSQNQMNRRIQSNNSSGFKGVDYRPEKGKWRATIFFKGKHVHLGYRDTAEECSDLCAEAARSYFGEFACSRRTATA